MKASNSALPPTREIAVRLLPQCRCGRQQSGNWTGGTESHWLVVKPEATEQAEPALVEYECLSCKRRYRLRDAKLYEVLGDGSERAFMRQGQYGRWLSCR